MSDEQSADQSMSEADKVRLRIDEKREALAGAKADALQATHDAAAEHELALLLAEEARLDAEIASVPKPAVIADSNSGSVAAAKAAAELYSSGTIAATAPMDVASAVVTDRNNSDVGENVPQTAKEKAAARRAAAAQAAADEDKGSE